MRKVFITGISRGLGNELFHRFASKGYFVYGVVRNESDVKILKNEYSDNTKRRLYTTLTQSNYCYIGIHS